MSRYSWLLAGGAVFFALSKPVMATLLAAPGPEIGTGLVGAVVAGAVGLGSVIYPRLKKTRK